MFGLWAYALRLFPWEMRRRELTCTQPYRRGTGADVGCGEHKVSPQAIGVDLFAYAGVDLVADVAALPFQNESLDYVCSIHSLEHCRQPQRALGEWFRVLRCGAPICLVLPDVRYTGLTNTDRTAHWHHWALDTFLLWLRDIGLEDSVEVAREACPRWSFLVVLRKSPVGDERLQR